MMLTHHQKKKEAGNKNRVDSLVGSCIIDPCVSFSVEIVFITHTHTVLKLNIHSEITRMYQTELYAFQLGVDFLTQTHTHTPIHFTSFVCMQALRL